ncbi:MAG TPA: hypothetical protein VM009_00935 [Terriglobales bacterium]|nr:hypothetical protein [Terriglobales bacterium]
MDIRALIAVDGTGPLPLGQVDVLGASLLERMVASLAASGISEIVVVSAHASADAPRFASPEASYVKSSKDELWQDALQALNAGTVNTTIVIRLSHYCEADWPALIRSHQTSGAMLTRAWAPSAPLDIFVVERQARKDAEFLVESGLRHTRLATARHYLSEDEYVHPLHKAGDLREIALDALNLRCKLRPVGRELRPGIWMAEDSRVDAGVRLVAPIFIGKRARVRTGAVITRGSALEHHSSVDCGTVIENTSLLPFAAVGAGLDFTRTVVGSRLVVDLKRNVAVDIHDRKLVNESAHNAGVRVLAKTAALAAYVPLQFWRGIRRSKGLPQLEATKPVCANEVAKIVINEKTAGAAAPLPKLALERYGNQ